MKKYPLKIKKNLLGGFLFLIVLFSFYFFRSQIFLISAQEDCQSVQECEDLWQKMQEEIKKLESMIANTEQEKRNLQNQISILKSKIKKLELEIQQGNLMIADLNYQILDTENSINKTSLKIEDSRIKLANILKIIYQEEQKSLLEIFLTEKTISGFFDNLVALENLNQGQKELLNDIKDLKLTLENEKEKLSNEKEDLARTVKVQTLQKQQSDEAKKEQEKFLKMTEAQYQQYLKEKKELEKRAAEIRNRIVQLTLPGLAVPKDNKELYQLAKWAGEAAGGVRPALVLGLIEVESALGTNVGQCNCADQNTCRHPELTYKKVMPSSQWAAFEQITKELGLSLTGTPVSCYVNGGRVQMGGAMGPAQFMPNTWLNLGYKDRVESITGVKPANPWRARDAFLAAALYLADFNAKTQKRENEMGAVTAYLCGTPNLTTRCINAGGRWYRDTVMEKTDEWQALIDQGDF